MRSIAGLLGVALVASLATPGCAALRTRAVLRDCPDTLAGPEALGPGERLEGTYRSRDPGGESVLRVILERRDERLVVVALTAIGAPAFEIVQRGDEVAIDAPLARFLAVPPPLVLRDLHRIHFPGEVGEPPPGVLVSESEGRVRIERPACGHEAEYEAAR